MNVKKLFDLTGKTALITGGSRGLGLQMAEALGEMGAKLAITARKAGELEEAKAHLKGMGIDALTVVNDLQNTDSVRPMVEQVLKSYGQIDILVNNAGAAWGAPAEDHPLDAWYKIINLNLTAVFLMSQTVGKLSMIPRKYGRIINLASIAGLVGTDPRMMPTIAYNASKGRRGQFHALAGGGMGAPWHYRECHRAGRISLEDVAGHDRQGRAGHHGHHADEAPRHRL